MKRGQAEDFFTDIIPAVVLIVLAIVLLGLVGEGKEKNIDLEVRRDMHQFSKIDLLTLMRSETDSGVSLAELFGDWRNQPSYFQMEDKGFVCTDLLKNKLKESFEESYIGWSFVGEFNGELAFRCDMLGTFGGKASKSVSEAIYLPSEDGSARVAFQGERR